MDVVVFALRPHDAIDAYGNILSPDERKEILRFPEVYFIGTEKSKNHLSINKLLCLTGKSKSTHHISPEAGASTLFRVIEGDHLAFRYQVISEIGRGAFG